MKYLQLVNNARDVPTPSGKWRNAKNFKAIHRYVTPDDGSIYKLISKQERTLSLWDKLYHLMARIAEMALQLFYTFLRLPYQNHREGFWPQKEVLFYGELIYPSGQRLDVREPDSLEFKTKEALAERALSFFQEIKVDPAPVVFSPGESIPQDEHQLIVRLLRNHRGFALGEIHNEFSSTDFLIENLPFLVEQGIKILFLEGLHIDQNQDFENLKDSLQSTYKAIILSYKLLHSNSYHDLSYKQQLEFARECLNRNPLTNLISYIFLGSISKSLDTPSTSILDTLSTSTKDDEEIKDQEIRLLAMMAAQRFNIAVLPIDHSKAYKDGKDKGPWHETGIRLATMNYIAHQIIQNELNQRPPEDKFVAWMGQAHLGPSKFCKIPGVPDLVQCPRVAIYSKQHLSQSQQTLSQSIQRSPFCLHGRGYQIDIAIIR